MLSYFGLQPLQMLKILMIADMILATERIDGSRPQLPSFPLLPSLTDLSLA